MANGDDPFADLEGALEDDDDESESRSDESTMTETATTPTEPSDAGGPAFTFDAVQQRPLYARPASWDAFEDALFDAEVELRNAGMRDVEKREFHDAVLRVLTEHVDEVVLAVLEARGELDAYQEG